MTERLVVIGGDAGGMAAASGVRRLRPDVEIVVIERGGRTSYAMCGIPYVVAGEVDDVESLVARSPEEFGAMDIEVRLHTDAVSVDLDRRTVETRDIESGATEVVAFDQLMVGTGARPVVPDWAEVDLPHVSVVHTLPDAAQLDGLADGCAGRDVVIVGGGYIGIEMAEAFLARGARVALVDRKAHLLGNLDPEMGERVDEVARAEGVELHLGVTAEGLTPSVGDHVDRRRAPRRHRGARPRRAAQHRDAVGGGPGHRHPRGARRRRPPAHVGRRCLRRR